MNIFDWLQIDPAYPMLVTGVAIVLIFATVMPGTRMLGIEFPAPPNTRSKTVRISLALVVIGITVIGFVPLRLIASGQETIAVLPKQEDLSSENTDQPNEDDIAEVRYTHSKVTFVERRNSVVVFSVADDAESAAKRFAPDDRILRVSGKEIETLDGFESTLSEAEFDRKGSVIIDVVRGDDRLSFWLRTENPRR